MSQREQTDKISSVAVRQLTKCLSLAPPAGQTQPPEEWLAQQKEQVKALPQSCRRPGTGAPTLAILRGVIKASEMFSDVPFVPDAAVLCKAHKDLHPWRIRSLFLLLASEVGIKSDRIRRHRGNDDLPPSDAVQAFVRRMTSVAGMWIEPDDFDDRFGFRPEGFAVMQSGCEACMLAAVGARAEVLVDLRANILARQKIGDNYKPAMLRFVESWIRHFAAHSGYLMMESDKLEHQLRAVRDAEYEKRRQRNERRKRRTGRDQKLPRRVLELNSDGIPVPRAIKRMPSHGGPRGDSKQQAEQRRHVTWAASPTPPDETAPGTRSSFDKIDEWRQEVERVPPDEAVPLDDLPGVDGDVDAQLDGRNEGHGQWVDEVGSYYFNEGSRDKGKGKDTSHVGNESDGNPGARANWRSSRLHPAFRGPGASDDRGRDSSIVNKQPLTGAQKLHALFRGTSSVDQHWPSSPRSPTTTGPSNRSTAGSNSSSSRVRGLGDPQLTRTGSTASLLGTSPAAPEESASLWTEGTLHTAGGRTDLGLAPPSPSNEFLATLFRDDRGVHSGSVVPAMSSSSESLSRSASGYPRQVDEPTLRILEGHVPAPAAGDDDGCWLGRPSSWSSSVYSDDEAPELPRPLPRQRRQSKSTDETQLGMFVRHHDRR